MPVGSILLGAALALLVVPFVAGPFVKDGRRKHKPLDGRGSPAPESSKHDALVALRDLDFDFRTGKIAEEDYLPLRQHLVAEAAQALQATETAVTSQPDWDADAKIEAAIRALRASSRTARHSACPQCHAPVGDDDRFCPKCGTALGITCPQCRSAVQATDKFCAHCGASLNSEVVPTS